jgi:dipeptidase E
MQHLFLTSSIGIPGVGESIRGRLGHDRQLKTAFITTPIEGDSDQDDLSWVAEDHAGLQNNGFVTFDYTITGKNLADIRRDLAGIDVLYISGGNEFYLREKSNESGFETFVREFCGGGGIYIGTSAGSIIAGTDMAALKELSDQSALRAPLDPRGFGLVPYTILPHWGSEYFRERWLSPASFGVMYQPGTSLVALNNFQYIEVVGSQSQLVDIREAHV